MKEVRTMLDFDRVIHYHPLYTEEANYSGYLLPIMERNGAVFTLKPVKDKYYPLPSESAARAVMNSLERAGYKIKDILHPFGVVTVRDIIMLDIEKSISDRLFEWELPGAVKESLGIDYDLHNGEDTLSVGIEIVNSYGGSAALKIIPMIFRFICLNGVVYGSVFSEQGVAVHRSNVFDSERFPEVVQMIVNGFDKVLGVFDHLKELELNEPIAYEVLEKAADMGLPLTYLKKVRKIYEEYKAKLTGWAMFNLLTYSIAKAKKFEYSPNQRVVVTNELFKLFSGGENVFNSEAER